MLSCNQSTNVPGHAEHRLRSKRTLKNKKMKSSKQKLWLALKAYNFEHLVPPHLSDQILSIFGGEDASKKAFAKKLSAKLGWSTDFALKAIDEYKKFVFLGVASDFNVTPSKVIDQVWHEHQLFTKGYREFCAEVIFTQFDHSPELVPIDTETGVFNAQYHETLQVYKTEFSIDPPEEIWGKPKFALEKISNSSNYTSKKKKRDSEYLSSFSDDNTPLYLTFPSDEITHTSHPEFTGFGGGHFGGAGAESSWDTPSHSHSDHGSSDSDSSSHSDSGHTSSCSSHSSCSSASSCSSSCGSSCGGGGD